MPSSMLRLLSIFHRTATSSHYEARTSLIYLPCWSELHSVGYWRFKLKLIHFTSLIVPQRNKKPISFTVFVRISFRHIIKR
ncbi:hypothetical protein BDP55DRAFT_651870 [Colletotrichum godetiae]|uniref:Uncharacterized protein n=1 Tax=Colletotrichum godetiae TaxID=1209918 RepID=A0AAJ0AT40_9PEZI|nr:uncharacterized protein BDP55DRAFT_651870 [Colletotrichum godetiae]KAK1689872.1 hypothetical protein BDP55DRAFT_651870 [Colletotrichum godetiae]